MMRRILISLVLATAAAAAAENMTATEQTMLQKLRDTLACADGVANGDALVSGWDADVSATDQVRLMGHFALGCLYDDAGNTASAVKQYQSAADLARLVKDNDALDEINQRLTNDRQIGHPLPEISGTALDGTKVDTADLRGKVVVVQFFASWCAPCRAELPDLVSLDRKYAGDGLQVVGVSLDNNAADLKTYLNSQPLPWPILADFKGWDSTLGQQFGIDSIPDSILVGPDGRIVRRYQDVDELDAAIGRLLGKSGI